MYIYPARSYYVGSGGTDVSNLWCLLFIILSAILRVLPFFWMVSTSRHALHFRVFGSSPCTLAQKSKDMSFLAMDFTVYALIFFFFFIRLVTNASVQNRWTLFESPKSTAKSPFIYVPKTRHIQLTRSKGDSGDVTSEQLLNLSPYISYNPGIWPEIVAIFCSFILLNRNQNSFSFKRQLKNICVIG